MISILAQQAAALPAAADSVAIDPTQAASGLMDAISSKQWGLVIGFGIMVLVWIVRTFVLPKLNTKWLPWIATVVGGALAFATAMVADPAAWLPAVLSGIQAGLAAAGTWGLLAVVRKK